MCLVYWLWVITTLLLDLLLDVVVTDNRDSGFFNHEVHRDDLVIYNRHLVF